MTDRVSADQIEQIVGVERRQYVHYGRVVSAEDKLYILHSHVCKALNLDLRDCPYSIALDQGRAWIGSFDKPIALTMINGHITERQD